MPCADGSSSTVVPQQQKGYRERHREPYAKGTRAMGKAPKILSCLTECKRGWRSTRLLSSRPARGMSYALCEVSCCLMGEPYTSPTVTKQWQRTLTTTSSVMSQRGAIKKYTNENTLYTRNSIKVDRLIVTIGKTKNTGGGSYAKAQLYILILYFA